MNKRENDWDFVRSLLKPIYTIERDENGFYINYYYDNIPENEMEETIKRAERDLATTLEYSDKVDEIIDGLPEEIKDANLLTAAEIAYDEGIIGYEDFNCLMEYISKMEGGMWE